MRRKTLNDCIDVFFKMRGVSWRGVWVGGCIDDGRCMGIAACSAHLRLLCMNYVWFSVLTDL